MGRTALQMDVTSLPCKCWQGGKMYNTCTSLLRAHGHTVFISKMFILLQTFCQFHDRFPLWGWWSWTLGFALSHQSGWRSVPIMQQGVVTRAIRGHRSLGSINRCWRRTSEMWSLARIFEQIKMILLSGPWWFPTHFLCIPNFLFYIYHVYLLKMSPSSAQEEALWLMWCLYDPGVHLRVSSHQLCVFGSSRWRPICLQTFGADESPEFHSCSPIWKWLSSRDLDLVCHISPCLC